MRVSRAFALVDEDYSPQVFCAVGARAVGPSINAARSVAAVCLFVGSLFGSSQTYILPNWFCERARETRGCLGFVSGVSSTGFLLCRRRRASVAAQRRLLGWRGDGAKCEYRRFGSPRVVHKSTDILRA